MPDETRRNPHVHRAILDAAWDLTAAGGWAAVSVDAIAARAGVGKRTVYRWWPSKAAVVLEAFLDRARVNPVITRATTAEGLLRAHARHFVDLYVDTELGRVFTGLLGAAQQDPDLAARLGEHWFEPRRAPLRTSTEAALPPGTDVELLLDLVFAPLHYRLLTGRRPLDHAYADAVVTAVLLGGTGN
ncbi:TetR/AcrR family transcriptional regulator [Amycolatopsis sp. FDAARGOS 1241]|uniref:TetR/AcrR family transcriptional regulator n=1 Tax=Amycolatopsis sp. FDAARGOS 1241 TaxID=2778070 RepID=UPI0019516EBA|nr:TetR/AcrR family transcriptional regulator [Amycolatopsis sp. FDAARGOS 1241]QRP49496.1 TetR/AcrR family transcriptional regulator [Amycolatopsis sp. FDAARGOS 1241]